MEVGKRAPWRGLSSAAAESGVQTQTLPFDPERVGGHIDLAIHAYLELQRHSRVYSLACAYIARHGDVRSLRHVGQMALPPHMAPPTSHGPDDIEEPLPPSTSIGLGLFPFRWGKHQLYGLHQTTGTPVGHNCGVDMYTTLVLFAHADDPSLLEAFCDELIACTERSRPGIINLFEWDAMHQHWGMRSTCTARSVDSIVLPEQVKRRLMVDFEEFLSEDTRRWYTDHGIPHKRGYLFHGIPGSGKTSLVQGLAGHFKHNICCVHLSHPMLTDDSLRAAVNQAPKRSILVLEDVDAVFGPDRELLLDKSHLTFSGLLNALDGVGRADGQIFVLTTNHRDRLNPALIRNGRADVHVEFTYATDEQIAAMFSRFYPLSTAALAQAFVGSVRDALDGQDVSMATLQHYFVLRRKSSASQAVELAPELAAEIASRAEERRWEDAAPKSALPPPLPQLRPPRSRM